MRHLIAFMLFVFLSVSIAGAHQPIEWNADAELVSETNGVLSVNIPKSSEHETEGYETGVGAVVEVYNNEVLLRFRDFDDGIWIEGYEYTFEF